MNNSAMAFKQNTENILNSINEAYNKGCNYRIGPELEISGYSCEDHFLELDTYIMSWLSLLQIINQTPSNIMVSVGMPVL